MDINLYLENEKNRVDSLLKKYLLKKNKFSKEINEAMEYSLFAGGKRIRPILSIATAKALGIGIDNIERNICALELIHTYSLIHDDLPAMDNDDYRRGKLTNHKVYGEGIAILAGDAMLTYAFQLLLENVLINKGEERKAALAGYEIARLSGVDGMVGGQTIDLISEGKEVDKETLEFIHKNKTSALIIAAIRSSAIISGANKEELKSLTNYAENIGLVFQIRDDVLDVLGSTEKLGKKVGSDIKNQKQTYPSMIGLEGSKNLAEIKVKEAIEQLDIFDEKADALRGIANYLLIRDH